MNPLKKEFDYYIRNQESLVTDHNGQVLLIHGEKVFGVFNSKIAAYEAGLAAFEPGTFLIVKCSPGDMDYSVNYRSRYRFSPVATA